MFTTIKRSLVLLPILLAANAGTVSAASSPIGTWIDHTGRGAVEITDCNGALCGHLVWLKSAGDQEACNMQILGNVKPVAGGKWDGGWIYDPERRAKYDVELTLLGDQKLKVLGYAGMKLFSETMTWTRAPADLKKCSKARAEAANESAAPPAQPAEARPSNAAAATPGREIDPTPAVPEKQADAPRPQGKERQAQARAKPKQCTISVRELGTFSFPC